MFLLNVVMAGVVGSLFMTGAMWFVHRAGWANADMTRALGSLVTRRYESSFWPGLLVHLVAGPAESRSSCLLRPLPAWWTPPEPATFMQPAFCSA
jgi:hypothetical protein